MSLDRGATVFSNNDDDAAVPVLKINDEDTSSTAGSPSTSSKSSLLGRAISPSGLRERFHAAGSSSLANGVQDRLFSLIFEQAIPSQAAPAEGLPKSDPRSKKTTERPNFSLQIMSANFRRFNARIGVVFVFQNKVTRLLSWRVPAHTLSFLAVYTFCCLDPSLLAVLPLAVCLLFIMVPTFIVRHPPPPSIQLTDAYEIRGPASAPPPNIKPAPEMSKDFFHNMRDLQNSMEDFSIIHDQVIGNIGPITNFSNERVSSALFLGLTLTSFSMFIVSGLLPWRPMFLTVGWVFVVSNHPAVARFIASIDKAPIKDMINRAHERLRKWINEDIVLDEAPEVREVEVFELQRRHGDDWQAWMFATSPFTPRSPVRISGDHPRGTRFFEDVQPPKGWDWSSKRWTLDLFSGEWVEERAITAVEVETDGARWVYDLEDVKAGNSKKDWEEGSGLGPKGEWRRRRWVRLVKRKRSS